MREEKLLILGSTICLAAVAVLLMLRRSARKSTNTLLDSDPLSSDKLPWFKINQDWYVTRWNGERLAFEAQNRQADGSLKKRFLVLRSDGPSPGAVQITFVRHGQGIHNVLAAEAIADGAKNAPFTVDRMDELQHIIDAPLTDKGREEARASQHAAKALQFQPKLLVVSPLQRAIDTGLLVFEHLSSMKVPIVAHEGCQEGFFAMSIPDFRRPLKEIISQYNPLSIDFSLVPENKEPVGITGETYQSLVVRARSFLEWLLLRMKEEDIKAAAVATHSIWLLALTSGVLSFEDPNDKRQEYFETGEMRTFWIRTE